MSEETTSQPTEPLATRPTAPQIINWSNLRCLYAEDIKDVKMRFKIAGIRDTPKGARLFCQSGETEAFDVAFDRKDKQGKTLYIQLPKTNAFGKRAGILRQYVMVCGNEPSAEHIGKEVVLYTKESAKSVTGKAIRIADVNE
jgi:hypothetical protein